MKRVYVLPLSAVCPAAVWAAAEAAVAEKGAATFARTGFPVGVVTQAVIVVPSAPSRALALLEGMRGVVYSALPNGFIEAVWIAPAEDTEAERRPYAYEVGTRKTLPPSSN